MSTPTTTSDKLAKFKQTFTKDKVEEFFGSYPQAIQFHQLQLNNLASDKKKFAKAIDKNMLLDSKLSGVIVLNQPLATVAKSIGKLMLAEFDDQIKILELKIEHLKKEAK